MRLSECRIFRTKTFQVPHSQWLELKIFRNFSSKLVLKERVLHYFRAQKLDATAKNRYQILILHLKKHVFQKTKPFLNANLQEKYQYFQSQLVNGSLAMHMHTHTQYVYIYICIYIPTMYFIAA